MIKCFAIQSLAAAMILLAAGCTNAKKEQFPKPLEYYTENAKPVKSEPLPAEYLIQHAFICHYTPFGLIGKMELPDKNCIHMADPNTGVVIHSALQKGRGPKETLANPYTDIYGNTLYANDPMGSKVFKIDFGPDTLNVEEYFSHQHSNNAFTINIKAVSDSLFVFFQGTRTGAQLILTDNSGTVLDTRPYPVLDDPLLNKDQPVNFNVVMDMSPCRKWLFVQNMRYSNIRKYRIEENKIKLENTYTLLEPKYTVDKGMEKMREDNVIVNPELYAGEKYIYMLVHPQTLKENRANDGSRPKNYILVFDYNFNLVESYLCNEELAWLALTPHPATIYGSDPENHCMHKITLPELPL